MDQNGTGITDEVETAAKDADAVLLGAIGGPVSGGMLFVIIYILKLHRNGRNPNILALGYLSYEKQ
jgi:isocitrate/isopropylmalate dehydrogenase